MSAYTMGIALPKWIVEAQNNIYVLGVYGILFGVLLPYYVVCMHRSTMRGLYALLFYDVLLSLDAIPPILTSMLILQLVQILG